VVKKTAEEAEEILDRKTGERLAGM